MSRLTCTVKFGRYMPVAYGHLFVAAQESLFNIMLIFKYLNFRETLPDFLKLQRLPIFVEHCLPFSMKIKN